MQSKTFLNSSPKPGYSLLHKASPFVLVLLFFFVFLVGFFVKPIHSFVMISSKKSSSSITNYHQLMYKYKILFHKFWEYKRTPSTAYSSEFKFTLFITLSIWNILVYLWLKLSNVLAIKAYIGVHIPIVEIDYVNWFSVASGPFGDQVSCGISTIWDHQSHQSLATHFRAWSVSMLLQYQL